MYHDANNNILQPVIARSDVLLTTTTTDINNGTTETKLARGYCFKHFITICIRNILVVTKWKTRSRPRRGS